MIIVVDGNDGVGKSTLVRDLKQRGFTVEDRGIPTKMTDDTTLLPSDNDNIYLILDAPVSVSQDRLRRAGKDLTEPYHTPEDLEYYRERFLRVAEKLGRKCRILDANKSSREVLVDALDAIRELSETEPIEIK
jgi:thymidylate kinase